MFNFLLFFNKMKWNFLFYLIWNDFKKDYEKEGIFLNYDKFKDELFDYICLLFEEKGNYK